MSRIPVFVHSNVLADLRPAPINPSWILEGKPIAKVAEIQRSHDGNALTLVWSCTPGKFNWFYDSDETLYLLEGVVFLDEGLPTERRIGPGDVVFFPAGSHAQWRVETAVRKVAFLRRGLPARVTKMVNVLRKFRNLRSGSRNSGFAGSGFGSPVT